MLNDDWLILKDLDSNYNTTHVSYWNCHSQQLSDISNTTTHRSFITLLKDTNNEAARVPKVLLARRNENLMHIFTILSETESPVLKNLAIRGRVKDLAGITSIDATSIFCPTGTYFTNQFLTRVKLPQKYKCFLRASWLDICCNE